MKMVARTRSENKLLSLISVNAVLSNYDLLIEILLRLPLLSLLRFKSVSKFWLSIITSPRFISRLHNENSNLNTPIGLLIQRTHTPKEKEYDFESFDNGIPSKRSVVFTFGCDARLGCAEVLQSCNGLLLCFIYPYVYYVYNPTRKLFKKLPMTSFARCAKMAFDPTKSDHYKVIMPVVLDNNNVFPDSTINIRTYSSETGLWKVCSDQHPGASFEGFEEGVYWNEAIHWLTNEFRKNRLHFKLDVKNEQQPVLTELQLPVTCNGKPHFQSKLFESRGCLLLICKDYAQSRGLNVFEMRRDDSEWLVKFVVNLDDIMMPLPRTKKIHPCIWSIVLGESEEDSFMIIDFFSTVVQYNPVLKTVRTLADLKSIGSPQMVSKFHSFHCIASLAEV